MLRDIGDSRDLLHGACEDGDGGGEEVVASLIEPESVRPLAEQSVE